MQYFAQRGMDVYHVAKLCDGCIATHQGSDFLHHISSMSAKGMTAGDTVIVIREELQHTLTLAHRQRLAIGTPERLAAVVAHC